MSDIHLSGGTIRKLWPTETKKFRDHLLRLDKSTRRDRFAHGVSDEFIADYADRMNEMGSIVFGYIADGKIRAVAELRKLGDTWGKEAEAAFSVEQAYQEAGIGTELMGRVIRCARNRGVQHLFMSCLAQNRKMQAIARKYNAELRFEVGEVIGDIVPDRPDYFSIFAEVVDDRVDFMMAVLSLERIHSKIAA
ncbi:MAG: GNAT family N-acetyltransferase [Pseudomonadota bacterium]